jgi:hypothetical protein
MDVDPKANNIYGTGQNHPKMNMTNGAGFNMRPSIFQQTNGKQQVCETEHNDESKGHQRVTASLNASKKNNKQNVLSGPLYQKKNTHDNRTPYESQQNRFNSPDDIDNSQHITTGSGAISGLNIRAGDKNKKQNYNPVGGIASSQNHFPASKFQFATFYGQKSGLAQQTMPHSGKGGNAYDYNIDGAKSNEFVLQGSGV